MQLLRPRHWPHPSSKPFQSSQLARVRTSLFLSCASTSTPWTRPLPLTTPTGAMEQLIIVLLVLLVLFQPACVLPDSLWMQCNKGSNVNLSLSIHRCERAAQVSWGSSGIHLQHRLKGSTGHIEWDFLKLISIEWSTLRIMSDWSGYPRNPIWESLWAVIAGGTGEQTEPQTAFHKNYDC